jgi:predicted molibdopterin-dependent oxidoreductase YjgC
LHTGSGTEGHADLSALRTSVDKGTVQVLYVLDPGPEGSLGDTTWLVQAKKAGRLPVMIYEGVQSTELARIADVVLPGAAWVEKDATYTNDKGLLQAASKVINPPGEAVEDWQIITSVAAALGLPIAFKSSQEVRSAMANALSGTANYAALATQVFSRPLTLQHWLQASNPMERLKWNVMFQDLPPVKGHNVQMEAAPQPAVIPLKLVTEEIFRSSE